MQILKLLENHTGTNLQSGNDFRHKNRDTVLEEITG